VVRERIGLVEALGLRPFGKTARETLLMLRGDASTPKTRFDLSSLQQLRPRYSLPLWLGRKPHGRLVPITNLYNYHQPPPELGWSVRVTDVRDFRARANTYDSHNGTDLAVPPGTRVVAAAAGVVLRVSSEFHRGGLKVFIDHGRGLVTTYNHLARSLVRPGQRVRRAEPIAISGYSGVDALLGFPWTPPHVHFNCWLNGVYVDPFSPDDSPSLWRKHNDPVPGRSDDDYEPTEWNERAIERAIECCAHEGARAEIADAPTREERIGAALMQVNYFPTRFREFNECFYAKTFPREPRLDLPFSFEDYDGVMFTR
jgi:hypothetical protein